MNICLGQRLNNCVVQSRGVNETIIACRYILAWGNLSEMFTGNIGKQGAEKNLFYMDVKFDLLIWERIQRRIIGSKRDEVILDFRKLPNEKLRNLSSFLFTNGSGAHPASYLMGTTGSFLGGIAAGAWRWSLTSIYCRGQRMCEAVPPLLQHAVMAWCLVKAQGQLYLYFNVYVSACATW